MPLIPIRNDITLMDREYKEDVKATEVNLNKIKGSLVGGAVGDALGYAIEFWGEDDIFGTYGPEGIQEYELDHKSGKALISDDTQMSLFTANGLLLGETRGKMRGIAGPPHSYVEYMYRACDTRMTSPGQ